MSNRPSSPAVEILAHIDGASRGNPGPAAYAVVIESVDGLRLETLSRCIGKATNNFAEYQALLAALDYALEHGYRRLRVVSDSELLVLQMQGVYKVKHPDMKRLHREARARVARLVAFEIQHVRREQNREADRLANLALDEASRGGRLSSSPGSARAENVAVMATFHAGVLEPHEKLPLEEGEQVEVEIRRRKASPR
jgi:probable phosphoglycerate mutase